MSRAEGLEAGVRALSPFANDFDRFVTVWEICSGVFGPNIFPFADFIDWEEKSVLLLSMT
jgi:hypothetical protein